MGISPKVTDGDVVPAEQGVVIGSPLPPFAPTHVSHKQVEAYPIAAAEFRADGSGRIALKGGILVDVPAGFASRGAPSEGDMLVRYEPTPGESDGYLSHSPRMVFEAGYTALPPANRPADATGKPAITRAEADASLSEAKAPRVTVESMEAKVESAEYFRSKTLTICILTLANGFTIVGKSACASPENYNQALGERYAYDDAFRQIWAFEGYLLRNRLAAA